MPRKKKLPDSGETEPEVATQEVEALHTVKYKTPMRVPVDVPVDEPEEEDEEEFDLEEIEEEEKPKRRAPQASFRNKIKQKFVDKGIGGGELIALRIDQLPNYAVDGISGINAEKIFRDALKVTEDYFDNESYLANILRKYGPGDYWLTARVKNSIVHNWLERIGAPNAASPQATRTEGEIYSASSQMPFYPAPQAPPTPQKSFVEQIEEFARISAALNKIQGRSDANTAQNPIAAPVSDDVQLASILMKDPDVKAKAIKGLLGTAGDESDLTAMLIQNGPALLEAAGKMLQGVIQQAVIGIDHIRSQNGQAQTGSPQVPHSNGSNPLQSDNQTANQSQTQIHEGGLAQANSQSWQMAPNQNASDGHASQNVSPEDQALDFILGQCAQKVPIKIAADRLFNVAEEIRGKAPANSIDGYVEMFADTPLDFLVQWLGSTYPDSQTVLDMPHAKDWIAGLQEEVKRQINEGGEDEE